MSKEKREQNKEEFINPTDPEKVAENPGLLAFPHTVGGAIIKPGDKGKIKGRAVSAMHEQTDRQMEMIYEQIRILARQAQEIKDRVEVSERIYTAEMRFEPLIGREYYLYRKGEKDLLSMVSPEDWGGNHPYDEFIARATLLSDHTWEVNKDENP